MSDVRKAKSFLETSVLATLLSQSDITDITYNGQSIYVQSSIHGRKKASLTFDYEMAYQLIKQLANYMNVPFTYLDPIVEMSVAQYRIFAVGPSISRKGYQPALTFAIRIHPPAGTLPIRFLTKDSPWLPLFTFLLEKDMSMVIAGKTGSGKTQLQKELLSFMPEAKRVIVLDNILELDGLDLSHLDLTLWQVQQPEMMQMMVTGALRSHPDWLIIAESRGKEFKDILRSVKTGHPIITTMHSDHLDHMYDRMVSMLLIDESVSLTPVLFAEVKQAFPVLIYVSAHASPQGIQRRIDAVSLVYQGHHWSFDATTNLATIEAVIQQW